MVCSSSLSSHFIKNIALYDTKSIVDPLAKPSKIVKRLGIVGDGDIWVESVCRNRKSGSTRLFFVSQNTGQKVRDEPPTGASQVLYLKRWWHIALGVETKGLLVLIGCWSRVIYWRRAFSWFAGSARLSSTFVDLQVCVHLVTTL